MFTFSFGSAFAIVAGDAPDTISDSYFENLWADFVKVTTDSNNVVVDTVPIDTYTVDKAIVAGFKAEAKEAYDAYMKTATDYVTTLDAFKGVILADTTKAKAFKLAVAAAQFAADKNDAIAKLGTVPTYNYSTKVMTDADATKAQNATAGKVKFIDKDYTYQQAAEKLVEYFKGQVEDLDDFDADVTVNGASNSYKATSAAVANVLASAVYPVCTEVTTTTTVITSTGTYDLQVAYSAAAVKSGNVDGKGTANYVLFDATSDWSAKGVETDDKTSDATIAAVKAQIAADYAKYVVANPKDTEYADKWLKVANTLAENKIAYENIAKVSDASVRAEIIARAKDMSELEDYAAKWGAEKDANGQLVRDTAKVKKALEDGLFEIAKGTPNALAAAKSAIDAAKTKAVADELAFVKESAKKAMELYVSDAEKDETYYDVELAKVKGYAETYTAKVEAAANKAEVQEAYETFLTKANAVNSASALNTKWKNAMETEGSAANALYDAAYAYAETYYNTTVATEDSAKLVTDTLKARIAEMIGKSGVRTEKEIKALKDEAVKVAQALPTKDAVKAAKKAAEDAIKAIPAKTTVADLAAVQAASAAVKAYVDLKGNTTDISNMANYTAAVTQLVNAYNSQFAQQVAKLSATDEAAIKATIADIDATLDILDALKEVAPSKTFLESLKAKLKGADYLGKIKQNEKKAVEDAIKAIPVNVTEADKATVEKARKLYDEYVAKYNDYEALYNTTTDPAQLTAYDYVKGYAAFNISELTAAETVLGLNTEDPAMAVKAFKIKASSKATKGAMTITWRVIDGDKSAAKGYQVWRSTKANKGFKKMITTKKMSYKNTKNLKKGTTYYYRVRAYARTAEGKLVFSDFSNKAYRKAK